MNKMMMPTGGRTARGRDADLSSQDHYISKIINRVDGAGQAVRKAIFRSLNIPKHVVPTRDEVIERIRDGLKDFEALVALAGGEKLPGCGAVAPIIVGLRPKASRDSPRLVSEAQAGRFLELLCRANYYFRERKGAGRSGVRKEWPGLLKKMLSLSPGDSGALIEAVRTAAMSPDQFQAHLKVRSLQMRDEFRSATKLKGASAGCEVEMVVWHLEQGCLHAHLYFRDIDLSDPERRRLGLFGFQETAKKDSSKTTPRPRLTLNSLGTSGVACRRHRTAGHEPPLAIFHDKEKKPFLCRDWQILEAAEAGRASKDLGPCWDAVMSDSMDSFWAGVFSGSLKKLWEVGQKNWGATWKKECAAKFRELNVLAQPIIESFKEIADHAKADAEAVRKKAAAKAVELSEAQAREKALQARVAALEARATEPEHVPASIDPLRLRVLQMEVAIVSEAYDALIAGEHLSRSAQSVLVVDELSPFGWRLPADLESLAEAAQDLQIDLPYDGLKRIQWLSHVTKAGDRMTEAAMAVRDLVSNEMKVGNPSFFNGVKLQADFSAAAALYARRRTSFETQENPALVRRINAALVVARYAEDPAMRSVELKPTKALPKPVLPKAVSPQVRPERGRDVGPS